MSDEEDRCATCGKVLAPTDEATAHWGSPMGVTIVAWTCSDPCTEAYVERMEAQ